MKLEMSVNIWVFISLTQYMRVIHTVHIGDWMGLLSLHIVNKAQVAKQEILLSKLSCLANNLQGTILTQYHFGW